MLKPETLFSAEEQKRISDAVHAAEAGTAGEIVPFVVGQSDGYPEAPWRAGTLLGALVLFTLAGIWIASTAWLPYGVAEAAALTAVAFALAALVVMLVPRLRLLFVTSHAVSERVDERAAMAFLAEEVFATRERTGIMIFLSLLERRVRILGDSGINAKVKQEEWDAVSALIVTAMKRGAATQGLIDAIGRCGALLEKGGVEIRPDDTNELGDSLRMHST